MIGRLMKVREFKESVCILNVLQVYGIFYYLKLNSKAAEVGVGL